VVDQVIQWGIEDTPGHVINFMAGRQPWVDPEEYRASSPLYRLGAVTTPTLIHVGENDPRVPVAHSRALYRALRQYLEVPTELVVYPGAGHSLVTHTHRKAKMEWDLAWFRRYLSGDGAGEAE
jgi:dipeptidyl aminopeptidase/acylaminoacyl peptidase